MTRAPQAQMTSRARNECRNWLQTVSISLVIALVIPLTSCKNSRNQEQSSIASAPGVECVGQWLGSFIEAIPLPGFAVLGEVFGGVGKAAAQGAAGALKSTGAGQAKTCCEFGHLRFGSGSRVVLKHWAARRCCGVCALEDPSRCCDLGIHGRWSAERL